MPQMLSDDLLDTMMLEYLETLYFEGHNHASGDRLMAALEYRDTQIKKGRRTVPKRARDALREFRRLAPGLSRAPLPWVALTALVGAALHINEELFALALVVQFCCYLRQLMIERLLGLVISFCRLYDIGEKPNPIKRRSNPV